MELNKKSIAVIKILHLTIFDKFKLLVIYENKLIYLRFYGQLPLVCVRTLTPTCHLSSLQNKRRKQACLSTKVHTVCPQWCRAAIHISRAPEGGRLAYL